MKENNKMKYVDIAVSAVFVLALVVIYFFWGCKLDLYVTVLAGIVIVASGAATYVQNKKIKEMSPNEEHLEKTKVN